MKSAEKPAPTPASKRSERADNRAAQRHQKESQVAQLSAANVEESPHMDRGDSEGGTGESLPAGERQRAGGQQKRGAVDTQYGTKSADKLAEKDRASSSGTSSADDSSTQTSKPGSSEQSSGTERDTMSGPRPGSAD